MNFQALGKSARPGGHFATFGMVDNVRHAKPLTGTAMTDLNSLVIFAKVVEVKSFSEAARRLNIPISTVSRRIADLEDQLGVRLLERSTRNLRLTEVASEVLEYAQHSAELSETVDNIASNHMSNVSGLLRISSPPS